ncbi:serine hydrolase domain-containing protein [Parasphingorhabdus halotolerans]|uniref:Beta-lactamase family protein n=1 Tax=Parasphingorhabdus halotolerans TaxID=2725558 RepID=A0A6H2DNE0_9SPHN|nr:serine hydrolase domain-containing protein [Parasphingorhabdus halotolerans]QJB69176.1 beta-lactamase family protein [Parasphingorhabdus halotolerans]
MTQEMTTLPAFDRRSVLGGFGVSALLAGIPQSVLARTLRQDPPTFPGLTKIINDYVAEKKVSGMLAAIGFGQSDPQVIAAGAQAIGSERIVDVNTLWRLYSQTKPVTGMAVMMLIEDGKLTMDQPLSDILPEFANMQVLMDPNGPIEDTEPAKIEITIRHLLTHTAGLGYSIISKGPILKAYLANGITPGVVSRMPIPGFEGGAPTPDAKTFSKNLASLPLVYQPGAKWSYSVSLDLLSYVVEVASGLPLDKFLQARMFDPLGMKDSFFQLPADRVGDFATNYAPFAGALIPIDPAETSIYLDKPAFAFGGAGMISSAADYDKFLKMLLGFGTSGGVTIMKPETAKLGMSNLLPEGAEVKGSWVVNQGFGAGGRVGLGTPLSPAGTYGWGGAAGTSAFVDTVRGLRAGGYTQYMPSNTYPFQSDFPKYVYADLTGETVIDGGKTS